MIEKKTSVGHGIKMKNSSWSFNRIGSKFQDHVESSVPFYNDGHEIILDLSDFFLQNNTTCIDIGCSTGLLLKKIH